MGVSLKQPSFATTMGTRAVEKDANIMVHATAVAIIFTGGNNEASNHLWELFHGGWVAPNIYYLGHAGVVEVGGLRIAGLSGIFKGGDYRQGHWERPPYDNSSMRSAYHVREYDV